MKLLTKLFLILFNVLLCSLHSVALIRYLETTKSWHIRSLQSINHSHFINLSNNEIINFLGSKRYDAIKSKDDLPQVTADAASSHQQVTIKKRIGRSPSNMIPSHLWKPKGKYPTVFYYYHPTEKADKTIMEAAFKRWSDHTCIKTEKMPDQVCKKPAELKHGAVCVGDFGGCFSDGLGDVKLLEDKFDYKDPQRVSAEPGKCDEVEMTHEVGHVLGMNHQYQRSDRGNYITLNYHNFIAPLQKARRNNALKVYWQSSAQCKPSEEMPFVAPLPYDYMSTMSYGTAEFTDQDSRAVFVTKDPAAQYMLDYHREAKMFETHYDRYIVNTAYGCIKIWSNDCKANGKSVPKCQNLGYLGKDCKCLCPEAFSGDTCQTQQKWSIEQNSIFPILPNAFIDKVHKTPKSIDLSELPVQPGFEGAQNADFKFYLFFTILIEAKLEDQALFSIKQNLGSKITSKGCSFRIIKDINDNDCKQGITLYWGKGSGEQYRTECVSSLANNEPEGPFLRSSTNKMNLIYMSKIGKACGDVKITREVGGFTADVHFQEHPGKKTGQTALDDGSGDWGDGEAMTGAGVAGLLDKLKKSLGKEAMIGILAGVPALLCCCCCLICFLVRNRDDEEENEDDEDSTSSSGPATYVFTLES